MLMLSTYFSTHIFFAAIQVYVDTSSKEEMQMIKIDFDKDSHDTWSPMFQLILIKAN